VVNNKIYAIGGEGVLTRVEEYDPTTNTWTNCGTPAPGNNCASMPTGRRQLAVGVVNNKIYAIGGTGGETKVEEYDPATNTWTTKASMPTARYGLAIGVVNNNIYTIGGYGSSGALTTVEEYSPATDQWMTKVSMPTARHDPAIGVINNKIYVIGGSPDNDASFLTTVEEYDPAGADPKKLDLMYCGRVDLLSWMS
jgi:N-acetylneuraminic acid mutarotase